MQVIDNKGVESMAKFQICEGRGRDKVLGSVSRLIQSGHTVVCQAPEVGSHITNNSNGYKTSKTPKSPKNPKHPNLVF